MAKPRIFLSSTCFDLTDARSALTNFLEEWGFEVLNSQNNTFGVKPRVHSHDSCLVMMQNADYVVLIIGGRRGGTYVGSEQSITNEEIKAAQKLDVPIFPFLDKKVDALRTAYKKNPTADFKPTVDDVRVFDFIDYIASGHEDNWLHLFDNVTDIKEALRSQFAYLLLLYSQGLRKKSGKVAPERGQSVGFPGRLDGVPGDSVDEQTNMKASLREVYDALKRLLEADVKDSVKQEQMKAIWVIARHGYANDTRIQMKEDRFKGSAWGRYRGERVFNQMTGCGIVGEYDVDEDSDGRGFQTVEIVFGESKNDTMPAMALQTWVTSLVDRYGQDEGLELFKRLDMRLFSEASAASTSPTKTPIAKAKNKAA